MDNKSHQEKVAKLITGIRESYPTDKAIAEGYKWLEKNGERVYSEKGVSYTTDSVIKALRITAKYKTSEL
jgi:hypothetical protein